MALVVLLFHTWPSDKKHLSHFRWPGSRDKKKEGYSVHSHEVEHARTTPFKNEEPHWLGYEYFHLELGAMSNFLTKQRGVNQSMRVKQKPQELQHMIAFQTSNRETSAQEERAMDWGGGRIPPPWPSLLPRIFHTLQHLCRWHWTRTDCCVRLRLGYRVCIGVLLALFSNFPFGPVSPS